MSEKSYETLGGVTDAKNTAIIVVVDRSGRVFLDQNRHHRFDIDVQNVFDEEYATRLIRAGPDNGGPAYDECPSFGWPRTCLARYTYSFF